MSRRIVLVPTYRKRRRMLLASCTYAPGRCGWMWAPLGAQKAMVEVLQRLAAERS